MEEAKERIVETILNMSGDFSINQLKQELSSKGCVDNEAILDTISDLRDAGQLDYKETSEGIWAYRVV